MYIRTILFNVQYLRTSTVDSEIDTPTTVCFSSSVKVNEWTGTFCEPPWTCTSHLTRLRQMSGQNLYDREWHCIYLVTSEKDTEQRYTFILCIIDHRYRAVLQMAHTM
jgi:hypothetical protein